MSETPAANRRPSRSSVTQPAVENGLVFAFTMMALAAAVPISSLCNQPGVPASLRWVVGAVLAVTVLVVGFTSRWVRQ